MTMSIDALYMDLLEDLGLPLGSDLTVYPWDNPSLVAKKLLAANFVKKYHGGKRLPKADEAARDKFLGANSRCGAWQLKPETLLDECLLGQFHYWCWRFFDGNSLEPLGLNADSILAAGRNGPGASVGVRIPSFYTKLFASPLTCTSVGLRRIYTAYTKRFPLLFEAEENRLRIFGAARVVAGSRMSFAAKTTETSRATCTEPTLNMFCQLGIGHILENRLRQFFCLDITNQPDRNRHLARTGSLVNDMSTIDLSDASDSIALGLVDWCVPGPIRDWLHIVRSPVTHIPRYGDVRLNMISSMGNGFTFPLMTALLSCVVAAAFDVDEMKRVDNPRNPRDPFARAPNWAVFGDDIVVPKRVTSKVLRLLALLGFKPNAAKTFIEGPFRESCGVDAFNGVDVRGVHCSTLKTTQDRFTVINRLLAWSYRHGVSLDRSMRRLLRSVPNVGVPEWESEDCGIRVPERFLRIVDIAKRDRNGSYLYKRYVPRDLVMRIFDSSECVSVPRGMQAVSWNPAGLLLSFLTGNLEGASQREKLQNGDYAGRIQVKPNLVRYSQRTGVSPSWRYHPTVRSPYSCVGGEGREALILTTLVRTWRY